MRSLLLPALLSACATTPPVRQNLEHFSEGMTRPVFDSQALAAGIYTRAAREAGIEGLLVLRCVVMADGTVRQCQQLKTLPIVGDEMVSRLEAARIKPATLRGEPVSVSYVFNFSFRLRAR